MNLQEESRMNELISERDAPLQKANLHAIPQALPAKRWYFANFSSVAAAVAFVNAAPAQLAGEISGVARNDGTVGMFYFL